MLNLARNFSATGITSIILVSILFGYLYREDAVSRLVDHVTRNNTLLTQVFVNSAWDRMYSYLNGMQQLSGEQIRIHPDTGKFIKLVKRQTRETGFVGVEIYTSNGNTVYSTSEDRLGTDVSSASGVRSAFTGRSSSGLVSQNRTLDDGGLLMNRVMVNTYLPIRRYSGQQPVAAMQIQTDVTDAIYSIDEARHNAILLCGVVLTAIFLLLLIPVRRADSYLKNHSSKIKAQAQIIEHQGSHQALTGLPNRKLLIDRLQHAMKSTRRGKHLLAVMSIDIDRFKNINDTYGQEFGDILLVEFAERLKLCMRKSDTLAHTGGDDFTLICEQIKHVDEVSEIAHRLQDVISEPFRIADTELYVTPSIGIMMYPLAKDNESDLLNCAEAALVQVKREGGSACKFYSVNVGRVSGSRINMENAIRKALERDEFELFYQPFVNMNTGKVLGVEALIRWNSHEFGLVNPNDFIPLLEETGLIIPIGRWVLEQACKQGVIWGKNGIADLKVNVNVSVMQFHNREIISQVRDALESSGFGPHLLSLELTEGILLDDYDHKDRILDEINATGVSISLDDFGTGYSSLQYLKHIPIDTLKIDRSFIQDVVSNPEDTAIVEAISVLARTLRMNVIAEGVETEEQFAALGGMGVTAVQGYLISRPLPVDQVERLLTDEHGIGAELLAAVSP